MNMHFTSMAESIRMKLSKVEVVDAKLEQEMREFELQIDATIEPIAALVSHLRNKAKQLEQEAEALCLLRNLIQSLRGKEK